MAGRPRKGGGGTKRESKTAEPKVAVAKVARGTPASLSSQGTGRGGRGGSAAADSYTYPSADVAMRPEVGTQAQFRKKKEPKTYRYDSSLALDAAS